MSGKLRIAFYTDTYAPAHDGVVTSILDIRRELERRGHEVFIFTSGSAATRNATRGDDHVFVSNSVSLKSYPQYNLAILPLSAAGRLMKVKPDIVHAQTPFIMGSWGVAIAKISGLPVVSTFHTMFMDRTVIEEYATKIAAKHISRYAWRYAGLFYNQCNVTIAPSKAVKRILDRRGVRNVYVCPNGVNTARFNLSVDGSRLRKGLQRAPGERLVLYVGRNSKEKHLEVLLKAMAHMKGERIRAVVCGTGPAHDYYVRQAAAHGVSDIVTFTGFVPDAMLPKYYAACDVFCIPSTFETQGLVCLEAMACGKPVVAADSLALHDLISSGRNGEKFRPGDSKDCARKIKKAINNIWSYKETAQTAEMYSVGRAADRLIQIYEMALKRGRHDTLRIRPSVLEDRQRG